jgi:hypothetical protein
VYVYELVYKKTYIYIYMHKTIIPEKSITITFCSSIGRLGNYLYNIALCTRILYDINATKEFSNYKKYLYFCCTRTVPDGHGNENAYNHYENDINSYHNSIFKYNKVDKKDNIHMITDYYEKIEIKNYNEDEIANRFLKQLEKEERLLWAREMDSYEIYIDNFPFIIEVLKYKSLLMIYINNCNYEGISDINAMYKNLYPINNNIVDLIMPTLIKILSKYNDISHTFIYLNFVILSNYLTFHTDDFNIYFTKKIYNYQIDNICALKLIKNIYNESKLSVTDSLNTLFVSLHFRGGDYGDPLKDADTFAVIGPQYYIDCINNISNKNRDKNIIYVMFGAPVDLEFINNLFVPYLKKKTSKKIISYKDFLGDNNDKINTQLNLYFMGLFDYVCISNSTYSWWSSYFSHNFNNKKKLYSPLLYKYPLANYDGYNHMYLFKNKSIVLNNHLCNVMVFYGYNSSLYGYILLKRFIRQILVHIFQLNIDPQIFLNFILSIKKFLIKEKIIDKLNIENIIKIFDQNPIDKLKLKNLLEEIYQELFLKKNINSLNFLDKYERFVMINIKEIFCSKDRSAVEYKDMKTIEEGIIPIVTINDNIYHEIIG